MGLRDEITLRLGLAGIRAQELIDLTVGDIEELDGPTPSLHWTGKRYKPRRVGIGTTLALRLRHYLDLYAAALDAPPPLDAALICRRKPGRTAAGQLHALDWGTGLAATASIRDLVKDVAARAGLGHVAPHDLRRSAAGILHREKSDDGGHRFDLLDIQKVLGHADPVTTMKCYLDPMDTGVLDRAAAVLD